MKLLDLRSHLDTKLGVEIGKRIVEKEDLRLADDGTFHGNTLALPP